MKIARLTMSALALTASVVLFSCSDSSPVAPAPAPSAVQPDLLSPLLSTVSGVVSNTGLLTCSALPAASTTQTIGPAGGVIHVGPHTLVIPAGALSSPVTITASIKSEKLDRVHFEPEGLQFARPTSLTMSYAHCGLLTGVVPGIAYIGGNQKILEQLLAIPNLLTRTVTANVVHFSDYAVDNAAFSDHEGWW